MSRYIICMQCTIQSQYGYSEQENILELEIELKLKYELIDI